MVGRLPWRLNHRPIELSSRPSMTHDSRRSSRRPILAAFVVLGLSSVIPACGGGSDGVTLHPVAGQVLFQGKPLPNVRLVFRPAGTASAITAPVPIGQTDSEGKFRLSTAVGEGGPLTNGAPAGDYLVAITTLRRSDSSDFLSKSASSTTPDPIQKRYADPQTSGLKATIKAGENTLEPFDLKESGAAPIPVGSSGRGR